MKTTEQRLRDAEIQLEKHRVRGTGGTGRPYATITVAASDCAAPEASKANFFCSGVDDQVQIKAALEAAGGGNVTLLDGEYIVSAPIAPSAAAHGTQIQGSSTARVTIRPADGVTAAFPIFDLLGYCEFSMRDFTIDSIWDFETGDGNGIQVGLVQGYSSILVLQNLHIYAYTHGVYAPSLRNSLFQGCNLHGDNGVAVYGENWIDCVVDDCDISAYTHGIQLFAMSHCRISRNRISNTGGDGIRIGAV